MTHSRFRWIVVAILVLTTIAYWPALSAPYYLDDYSLFSDTAMLPGGANRLLDFARTRTLTYWTFFASFRSGNQNPALDHAVNLMLFLALVALAASLYRQLIGVRAALAATMLFALHPLNSEAVIYVFARASLLAAVFSVGAWLLWVRKRYWFAALLAGLAMASKEEAVVLPLFLLAFEILHRRSPFATIRALAAPLATMMIAAAFFALRVIYAARVTPDAGALVGHSVLTPLAYLQAQGHALWLYARLTVLPVGLNFDHQIGSSPGLDPLGAAGLIAIVALSAACLFWSRREPALFFPLGALLLLAPTSSIAPLADIAAERRTLLPLLCLAPAAGILASRIFQERWLAVAMVVSGMLLAASTYRRAGVWQDAERLWTNTVEQSPSKARPKLHLARALDERGAIADPSREKLLREATSVEPDSAGAWGELGLFLLRGQQTEEAVAALQTAYDLAPDDPSMAANLGVALAAQGQLGQAEDLFRRALTLNPCNFDARNNLLFLFRSAGDLDQARAVALPPSDCVYPSGQRDALVRAAGL
ncbi:MAG: tetratricopeptide repeat protein [Acidobacteria bacterium]|nr:tetratricopeptide repeat protein [Acidobacteriota bacterium]